MLIGIRVSVGAPAQRPSARPRSIAGALPVTQHPQSTWGGARPREQVGATGTVPTGSGSSTDRTQRGAARSLAGLDASRALRGPHLLPDGRCSC